MLIASDFVYIGGANKNVCFLTIELSVSVFGHLWFIFAPMLQIGANYFKGSGFLFQERWRQNVNLQSVSIMSQLSMHSRPEWTWHLLEGVWLHFYQPVPGHSFIKTCFLVTCGYAYTFLCLEGPLVPYQYPNTYRSTSRLHTSPSKPSLISGWK